LKFGSENQLNVYKHLSTLFCDFPLIARSGTGLPDEYFDKTPNRAKNRQEKGHTLFVI